MTSKTKEEQASNNLSKLLNPQNKYKRQQENVLKEIEETYGQR